MLDQYLRDHLTPRPTNDSRLTWYVTLATLRRSIAAYHRVHDQPVPIIDHVIERTLALYPLARLTQLPNSHEQILDGVRFHPRPDGLAF